MHDAKIISLAKLAKKVNHLKKQGEKIIFTNGCFDILHVGHIRLLKAAKKHGNILIVALNTDASVRKLKGKGRPIVPLKERMEILSAFSMIDYVTFFGEDTPEKIIKRLHPDVLVKGGDYRLNDVVGGSFVKTGGGKVVLIPYVKGKASTKILEKIQVLS